MVVSGKGGEKAFQAENRTHQVCFDVARNKTRNNGEMLSGIRKPRRIGNIMSSIKTELDGFLLGRNIAGKTQTLDVFLDQINS